LRILFITDSSLPETRGGAEVSAYQLALGLRELGHEIVFATRSSQAPVFEDRLFPGSLGAPVWGIPDAGGYLESGIAGSVPLTSLIVRMWKKDRFDLVHAHNWLSAYAAHRARSLLPKREPWVLSLRDYRFLCPSTYAWCFDGPRAGCGLVDSARCILRKSPAPVLAKAGGLLPYAAFRNATWKALARSVRSFQAFVCCSGFLRRRFMALASLDGPVLAVHNPVAIDPAGDSRPDGEEVLYLGRLSVEKGLTVLLSAFRGIAQRRPSARLSIVGGGPLEAEIARLSLQDPVLRESVRMVGRVRPDSVEGHYTKAAVVVTPSLWPEPLGRVPLEAMAVGRPVVATDAGGIPEVVEHGKTGVLVPPGDCGALGQALDELLADPSKRARMGSRGARRARKRFARTVIARRFVKVYEGFVPA